MLRCTSWALAALLGGMCANAGAATVKPSTCGGSAVQAAIYAAASGDTVSLPAPCSVTWDATVRIPETKGVVLQGNGAAVTRGTLGDSRPLISMSLNASVSTRVTGFAFTDSQSNFGYFITIDNGSESSAKFRIDHNTFSGDRLLVHINVLCPCYGLIDHDTFTWNTNNEVIHNQAYGPGSAAGWSNDLIPGSSDAVYIEDCIFMNNTSGDPAYFFGGSATQGYYGSRTVARFNTMTMAQIDQHGNPGAVWARWWEIYENTFRVVPNGNQSDYLYLRGGSGVAFHNHQVGTNIGAGSIQLLCESCATYPTLYQIGRGKNQQLLPAYLFGNDASMQIDASSSFIDANRDYYTDVESFTGTSGVGSGPIASRPVTCTTGVGYWATNEASWNTTRPANTSGQLYKCTSPNTWTLWYTPYAYPHPLQVFGSRPASPTNLRVIR